MLKQKNKLILVCLLASSVAYGEPTEHSSDAAPSEVARAIFEISTELCGLVYGTYQLGHFIKEIIAYRQTNQLSGSTEEELCYGPLNEYCRQNFAEKSTDDIRYLFDLISPQETSEAKKSEHRYKILCHFNLYQFPVFRRVIQQWPEYADHLLLTHHALKSSTKLRRLLDNVQGFKKGELRAYLQSELHRLNLDSPDNRLYTFKVDLPRPNTTL